MNRIREKSESEIPLKNISPRFWRDHCGVVMQEGYVFNDTIANNIAVGEDHIDKKN
jgi:ATP-binding cassette subfamily B protein